MEPKRRNNSGSEGKAETAIMLYKQKNLQPKLPKLLEWVEQMFPDI